MIETSEARIELGGYGESESDTRYLDITNDGVYVTLHLYSEYVEGAHNVNETFSIDAATWQSVLTAN